MTRHCYQIGLPGQPASFTVPGTAAIRALAEAMPPGVYWVDVLVVTLAHAEPVAAPYGELIVRGPGDWCLQALSGVTEGPGYLIV